MAEAIHEGRCLCGRTRYRATGAPTDATLCHCESCRRASGAPCVAWVTFPKAGFSFTGEAPRRHASSPPVVRTFCATCGTPLTYEHSAHPGALDVTVCSLEAPGAYPPADHTWAGERMPWLSVCDGLPVHPRTRRG